MAGALSVDPPGSMAFGDVSVTSGSLTWNGQAIVGVADPMAAQGGDANAEYQSLIHYMDYEPMIDESNCPTQVSGYLEMDAWQCFGKSPTDYPFAIGNW